MLEEKKIGQYILKKFVCTLICVGIAQLIINVLFSRVIGPSIADLLKIELLDQGLGLKEAMWFTLHWLLRFLIYFIPSKFSFFRLHFVERVCSYFFTQNYSNEEVFLYPSGMQGIAGHIYPILVLTCFLCALSIWAMPYVIAAKLFAKSVFIKIRELEEKRENVQKEMVKQRNLLLSDVSHDIKTPITTIAGFSQALVDGSVAPEKEKEYLDAIYAQSMKTVELVTLLFEYVKLDSEGFELHKTVEDIHEIVRGCIARSYTDFESKSMELVLNIPEDGYYLQVDRMQLERAIQNLLDNAWKHNPEGTTLWVDAKVQGERVILQISDNGVRIETETAKHLFDPFVQGDKSRTGKRGSGLGLSITRKIVEMHNGKVRLVQYQEDEKFTKTFEIYL